MRLVAAALVLLVGLYVVVAGLLFFFQSRLFHLPGARELVANPSDVGLPFESLDLEAADGVRLHGWLVPARAARRGVVLFFHGNAGNISHRLDSIRIFHELDLDTLIIDYRGYGQSEGRPSEHGLYADAAAALAEARTRGYGDDELVYFGRSLGGAIAAHLAARQPPAALILESTFTSAPEIAQDHYRIFPARLLTRLDYPTLENLQRAETASLIVHSSDDELISHAHGRRLYEAAREPKEFLLLEGDHNSGFLRDRARYVAALDAFLSAHLGR
jgi:uncharacterized protein